MSRGRKEAAEGSGCPFAERACCVASTSSLCSPCFRNSLHKAPKHLAPNWHTNHDSRSTYTSAMPCHTSYTQPPCPSAVTGWNMPTLSSCSTHWLTVNKTIEDVQVAESLWLPEGGCTESILACTTFLTLSIVGAFLRISSRIGNDFDSCQRMGCPVRTCSQHRWPSRHRTPCGVARLGGCLWSAALPAVDCRTPAPAQSQQCPTNRQLLCLLL